MTDYIKIDWADVRGGDVLKHESGDRVSVKAVQGGTHRDMYVLGQLRSAVSLEAEGFTPHRKVGTVPTEPGAYHDKDGVLCVLAPDSSDDVYPWVIVEYGEAKSWYSGEGMARRGPFARLVPMPTEEQVEQCLRGPGVGVAEATAAVMALLGGESDE